MPPFPQANSLSASVFVDQVNSSFLKSRTDRVNCLLGHLSTAFLEIHDG